MIEKKAENYILLVLKCIIAIAFAIFISLNYQSFFAGLLTWSIVVLLILNSKRKIYVIAGMKIVANVALVVAASGIFYEKCKEIIVKDHFLLYAVGLHMITEIMMDVIIWLSDADDDSVAMATARIAGCAQNFISGLILLYVLYGKFKLPFIITIIIIATIYIPCSLLHMCMDYRDIRKITHRES